MTFFFFFAGGRGAHSVPGGILFPQPGIQSKAPAVEAESLNHWTTREVPVVILICLIIYERDQR